MDREHQERIAANESLFRRHNEAILHALEQFRGESTQETDPKHSFMCECAVRECADMMEMTLAEYQHVRSNPAWFAVKPEHFFQAAERPVQQGERFWIVDKLDRGREVAEQTAPSSV